MADYFVSGKKGNGKSVAVVGRIRDALLAGRRVATNLDLRLENLLPAKARRVNVIRLPDKPTAADLEALGYGGPSVDEDTFGVLALDELATWLNARSFQDKTRAGVLNWLVHSRKWRWETYLIGQHIEQVDKQVRVALVEYEVRCRRLDRVKIPFLGNLIRTASGGTLKGNLPKMHVAGVFYEGIRTDRWWYRGADLYAGYDTEQKFVHPLEYRPYDDIEVRRLAVESMQAPYSYLTPWHIKGRYLPPTLWERVKRWWRQEPPKPRPRAKRLEVFNGLPPDRRWALARDLVAQGAL